MFSLWYTQKHLEMKIHKNLNIFALYIGYKDENAKKLIINNKIHKKVKTTVNVLTQ